MTETPPQGKFHIVALSHLAWEKKLFQRPQQLMTQFAQLGDEVDYFAVVGYRRYSEMSHHERIHEPLPNLRAQNLASIPFAKKFAPLRALSERLLWVRARAPFVNAPKGRRVLWLQNPRFETLTEKIDHDLLVYDVMDPHAAFSTADPEILLHENRLLKKADVVFTGGRSLHKLVSDRTDCAHCFPSGIDQDHFAKAAKPGDIPEEIRELDKPVLGYFGAVDERIDWELIERICMERSHWSIVFIGPLVVLEDIPIKARNFHFLGPRSYDRLPDYLRGFDVCLIPWKVNELTRYMSPTKTPEYLVSGRPVVSTPIPDVMADYPYLVLIGNDPTEFIAQCTKALVRDKTMPLDPPQVMSWKEIASTMRDTLKSALG